MSTGAVGRAAPLDASEELARAIQRLIEARDLRPGDRLGTERELAETFGVSRPTLREALRVLTSSRILRARQGPGGGIFVQNTQQEGIGRHISQAIAGMLETERVSLGELLDARLFLEVPLAGVAAQNATDETIAGLEGAIAAANGLRPGTPAFNEADARFHRILAQAAGNELLVAFTSWTLDVLQPSLIEAVAPRLDGAEIIAQHRAILRAVRQHQPAAAERAMRAHLEHLLGVVRGLDAD